MPVVTTDMRSTVESARRLRYEPTVTNTATDVQTAIDSLASGGTLPAFTPTSVNFAMSPYTVLPTDSLIEVDTSGGVVHIQTALSATRTTGFIVKDITGNADVNGILVDKAGAETIDGIAAYPIAGSYAAATFIPKTNGYTVI